MSGYGTAGRMESRGPIVEVSGVSGYGTAGRVESRGPIVEVSGVSGYGTAGRVESRGPIVEVSGVSGYGTAGRVESRGPIVEANGRETAGRVESTVPIVEVTGYETAGRVESRVPIVEVTIVAGLETVGIGPVSSAMGEDALPLEGVDADHFPLCSYKLKLCSFGHCGVGVEVGMEVKKFQLCPAQEVVATLHRILEIQATCKVNLRNRSA